MIHWYSINRWELIAGISVIINISRMTKELDRSLKRN